MLDYFAVNLMEKFLQRKPKTRSNKKILLAKCRKSVQEFADAPNVFEGETSAEGECSLKKLTCKI